MKLRILLLFFIATTLLKAQNPNAWPLVRSLDTSSTRHSFQFIKNERTKQVLFGHDLSVHYRTLGKGSSDSLRYRVRGLYNSIENDSMVIKAPDYRIHDKYKWNVDSSYSYMKNTKNGYAKVPLSDITTIYYERAQWKKVNTGVTILSLAAAFIVAPLIALDHGDIDLFKFRKVAYPALGVTAVSISVGIIFSQRKFSIRTPKNNGNGWTIKPGN